MDEFYVEYKSFIKMADWVLGEMRSEFIGKTCNLSEECFTSNGEMSDIPLDTDFEIIGIQPNISHDELEVKVRGNGTIFKACFKVEHIRNIR